MSETSAIRAALFGRLVDDLTREVLPGEAFEAVLSASGQPALRKADGYTTRGLLYYLCLWGTIENSQ